MDGGRHDLGWGWAVCGCKPPPSSCAPLDQSSAMASPLVAAKAPGSSELDDTEDDGGVSRSKEAEWFHQGHLSLSSMSAWTSSSGRLWRCQWQGGRHPLFFQSMNECVG
ncbi:hypothetical protein E2562_021665 [Oryza meyeriana var. granulata]|uniref:Uncharacterized protein n=1 Tax=Oryza meyeriana var. granulata TaxID=110450 RepID=A0A6G1DZK2_9ORYZ|nr:hypothetical protein E2562_021665 [Oryza meyeriana var. granulata]